MILQINSGRMTKLSLQIGDRTTSVEFVNEDVTYDELLEAFVGVMVGQTFSENLLIKRMAEYGSE